LSGFGGFTDTFNDDSQRVNIPNIFVVPVPEGWFWMGSDAHYAWERPRHRVWVDAFEIAQTPVTRDQYARFLDQTGHIKPAGWSDPSFDLSGVPVVGVNWFDAVRYCEWLSQAQDGAWRLPTEAEWEKACRGGLENALYAWGETAPSSIDYFGGVWTGPRPVGQGPRNGFDLCNIGDNVHEWCLDWYSEGYYSESPERNPTGPEEGTRRVSRGGSWRHQIKASRAAHRSSLPPSYRYLDYGFRVVRKP
jgi:formylglycine-generating enzyme required for sulfatase activity